MANEAPSEAITSKKEDDVLPPHAKMFMDEMGEARLARINAETEALQADYARQQKAFTDSSAKADAEAARINKEERGSLGKITEAAGALKPPEPAKFPEMPKVPDIQFRAFLEGGKGDSPWKSLNNMVLGLGLMATMGSAGKHPQYALNALAGAMSGWATGDHKRAENEWAKYLAEVTRAQNEQKRLQAEVEEKWKVYGANKDLLSLQLGMWGAEKGLNSDYVSLLMRDPANAMAMMKMDNEQLKFLGTEANRLSMQMMTNARFVANQQGIWQRFQARLAEQRKQHAEMINRFGAMQGLRDEKALAPQMQIVTGLMDIKELQSNLQSLQADGFLPKGVKVSDKMIAHLKQVLNPGDPRLQVVSFIQNPLVIGLFDRTVHNELGVRAQAIYQAQIDSKFANLPIEAVMANIGYMSRLFRENYDMRRNMNMTVPDNLLHTMQTQLDTRMSNIMGPSEDEQMEQ